MEKHMAEEALREFEIDMGLVTPETADISETHEGARSRQGHGDRGLAWMTHEPARRRAVLDAS